MALVSSLHAEEKGSHAKGACSATDQAGAIQKSAVGPSAHKAGREAPDLCVGMGDVVAVAGMHGVHLLLHLPDNVRDLHIVADCSAGVLLHVHDDLQGQRCAVERV